jgi:proline utilization trans-activator
MATRRLAAATGNPVGILDDSITTDPPTDAAGFPAVAALTLNTNLARITGQILQSEKAAHFVSNLP